MLPKVLRPKEKARVMTQAEYDVFQQQVAAGKMKLVSEHPSADEMRYFASFAEPFDPALSMEEIRKAGKEIDGGGQ